MRTPNKANSDSVSGTDRQATGNQPDQSTPTGGYVPSGGGGPSGPAGGDLAGFYPNPALAVIGAGAGPVGDGTHVAQVTIDAKGRVTTLASVSITGAPPSGTAGGDLFGTYPNPSVVDDSHAHTPGVSIPAYPTTLPPSGSASGDLTGTYPSPTLAAIGAAAGPIGDGTHVAQVSIDTKGRVTALSSVAITGAPPTGSAGGDLTGTYPNPTLAAIVTATTKGSATRIPTVTIDAKGRVTALTDTAFSTTTDYPYNILIYGADPTGAADSATAVNNAIAAINAAGYGVLFCPPGTYKMNSAATTITKPCLILGCGVGTTVFNFQGAVNGFTFDFSGGARACASCQAMTINTTSTGTQTALYFKQFNSSGISQSFVFRDIEFGSAWSIGIDIANAAQNNSQGGQIENIYFIGSTSATLPVCAIRIAGASNVTVSNCMLVDVTTGVSISGSPLCEGVRVVNVDVVNCKYGFNSSGANTWLDNCYANISTTYGTGGAAFTLAGDQNHLDHCYCTGNDSTATALVISGSQGIFSHFRCLNNSGVRWSAGVTVTGSDHTLDNFLLFNITNSAVSMAAGCSYTRATGMSFNDVLGATALADAGSNNHYRSGFGLGSNTDNTWNANPY